MLKPPASGPMGAHQPSTPCAYSDTNLPPFHRHRLFHLFASFLIIRSLSHALLSRLTYTTRAMLWNRVYRHHSGNIGPDHDLRGYAGVGGGMCRHPAPMRSTDHLNFTRPITVLHLAMTLPPHIHNDKSSVSHSRSQGPMYVGAFLGILHY